MRNFQIYYPLLLIILLPACTQGVFSIPPADIQYFENNSGRAIRIETLGVAIDTNRDSSLNIGHMVKTYYYQGTSNPKSEVFDSKHSLIEVSEPKFNSITELKPLAYTVSNRGLMFNTNPNKIGISIGINHYQRTYIPIDFNGIFYINSKLESKKPGDFYIKKE